MLNILFEDDSLIVCVKPVGVSSQSDGGNDMVSILGEYLGDAVYPVHRLDKAVGGVMVYAKTKSAAAFLSKCVSERQMKKEYLAVVHGCPENESGVFEDLLFKDSRKNKSFVVDRMRKGVKDAKLEYKLLGSVDTEKGRLSLVRVLLHTGRTHQIRVQFASRKMPLIADGKYGGKDNGCNIGLWSYSLGFNHPLSKGFVSFSALPPDEMPWSLYDFTGM